MADKFTPITDPQEADELTRDNDLAKPYAYKPNGHLWVDAEELAEWRANRDDHG